MSPAAFPNRFALLSTLIASVPFFQLGYDLVAIPHGLKLIDKTIETKDSELRGFEFRYGLLMLVGALLAGLLINYGGRRWPFAFGIVVYTVGSAVVSFGSRMATYRVGRSFMTIGMTINQSIA